MKTIYIAAIVILAIFIVGAFALYSFSISGRYLQSSQPSHDTCTKFSDTPYASNTYLISSDQLSQDAQTALSGFQLAKSQDSNGNTVITLTAMKAGYVNQSYTLKSGQSLYFIEVSFGDDNPQQDYSYADDHAVIVDSNGCIVTS